MDGSKDEYNMATENSPSTWALAQRVIGALVVASIVAVAGGGVVLRDAVLALRTEVSYLKSEMEKGGRFTALEGEWMDNRLKLIEGIHSLHETRLDSHDLVQEHVGAARKFKQHDKRLDALENIRQRSK